MREVRSVGIIGAGKLGVVLAQLSLRAGYQVYISGSDDPAKIKLTVETLAPGAVALTTGAVVDRSDIVILALPLKNFRTLDPDVFKGKLIVDAMNYWWETDGNLEDILPSGATQSEEVQRHLSLSRVVKGLNHMGYHHLLDAVNFMDVMGKKALALAGGDAYDRAIVENFIRSVGLDPLIIGDLEMGGRLEPSQPAFGANLSREELASLIGIDKI